MKNKTQYIFIGILCSLITLTAYKLLEMDTNKVILQQVSSNFAQLTSDSNYDKRSNLPTDFTIAAEISTPGVVHIKSTFINKQPGGQEIPEELKEFFGDDFFFYQPNPGPQKAEIGGSGVIINEAGYIITNNHVIENADEIIVILYDKRTFKAKVAGTDPATDLALLKIEAKELSSLIIGNSDEIKVGEWVLAVGNPFNLSSTVTAGIVSAKGRNIHILRDNYAIESFIQTDAAVNPGNSGGALVNLKGELIGINTAIATPTSMYIGYAFAVPSGIVKKVASDLIEFGVVQRGFLGVIIRDLDSQLAKELNLNIYDGVYVDSLLEGSSAKEAGIREGDIITKINDIDVKTASKLQELIGRGKPGEKVNVTIYREGKEKDIKAELKNREGTNKLLGKKEEEEINKMLGASFRDITDEEKKKYGIESGIQVTKLFPGKIKNNTDMREGFIITKIEDEPVKSVKEFTRIMEKKKGGVLLEGIYPGYPGIHYYGFGL